MDKYALNESEADEHLLMLRLIEDQQPSTIQVTRTAHHHGHHHSNAPSFVNIQKCIKFSYLMGLRVNSPIIKIPLIYKIWFYILHILMILSMIACMTIYILELSTSISYYSTFSITTGFCQFLILNPCTYWIIWKINQQMLLLVSNGDEIQQSDNNTATSLADDDERIFTQYFQSSLRLCYIFLMIFATLPFLCYTYFYVIYATNTYQKIETVIATISYFSTTLLQTGVLAYFIADQRSAYYIVDQIKESIENRQLTRIEYLQILQSFDEKDSKKVSLNVLFFAALMNSLFLLVAILSWDGITTDKGKFVDVGFSMVLIGLFGKELFIFMVMIFEIGKVNELGESLCKLITQDDWSSRRNEYGGGMSSSDQLMLYMTIKENPIGSKVFYFRPSRFQLLLQGISTIFAICSSVVVRFVISALT